MLVVIRTLTTFTWLLELLPELLADPRVQLVFAVDDEGSAYQDGAVAALADLDGRVVPWEQALATTFSLAISASPNGGLERLRAPLLILPHGPGYSKHGSLPRDGVPPVPALAAAPGWRTMLALSHEEQRHRWKVDPAAGVQAAVVGDPCIDRLRASMSLRGRYRRELGVSPEQKLVVTSSTWGPQASMALHPELPARLLAELPADEFTVAAILHPNVWVGHGPWQVRLWMRRALEGGLRLMPAQAGWQAALVAGDLLVGDHGSVSLYGAGLGLPLLFSAFSKEEIVGDGPFASLAAQAPHLEHTQGLRPQLEGVGFDRDLSRYANVAAEVFAEPGRALENLRDLVYEAISLEPPMQHPRVLPVPSPALDLNPVTSYEVIGATEVLAPRLRIAIERAPAGLGIDGGGSRERHLLVEESEPDRRLHDTAAAVFRREPVGNADGHPRATALTWLADALEQHPGARVAACRLDECCCMAWIRGEPPIEAATPDGAGPGLLASALYIGWVEGSIESGRIVPLEIAAGPRRLAVDPVTFEGVIPSARPAVP